MNSIKYKIQLVKEESFEYNADCLNNINAVFNIAKNVFQLDKQCEEVVMLLSLDAKLNVIGVFEVSRGCLDASIVSPREIFKRLLLNNAYGFILIHNHPSGNTKPSIEDIKSCKRIKECADIMNFKMIDFCIIGDDLYSFKEQDLLS